MDQWRESSYCIAGQGEPPLHQSLQGQPLDRAVLIVPQTVVIPWEEVPREGVVCQLQQ